MIATNKITSNVLQQIPLGSEINNYICKKIANLIKKELSEINHQNILTSLPVSNFLNGLDNTETYEVLYNKLLSQVDGEELIKMINNFIENINEKNDKENISLLKIYIFTFFIDSWCQLVDYIKETSENKLYYIGSKNKPEYYIIKKTLELKFHNVQKKITYLKFYIIFQSIVENLTNYIRKKRELNFSKFIKNFSNSSKPRIQYENFENIIIISVLEERRLLRISELHRELTSLGFKVILFSCLNKFELKRGLDKFPNLKESILYDYNFLDKNKAKEIINIKKKKFKTLFNTFRNNDKINNDCLYRGVPLFKYIWNDFHRIIKHRYIESSIDQEVIKIFLASNNVSCFIAMDNSVATTVWMNECKKRNIPTIFHFYNAVKNKIAYQILLESLAPNAWLLGGESQLSYFSNNQLSQKNKFYITGDIFVDTVLNCNKKVIRETIRKIAGLTNEDKVIVLLSSYIVNDFTKISKKIFFQSVINAANIAGHKVIIKAHPNENLLLLNKELKDWGLNAFVFQFENIRDIIIASDIVCMYFSEAAQQAMILEVPVISLVPLEMLDAFDKHWGYYSSGAVKFIPLGQDPTKIINNLLFDNNFKRSQIELANVFVENNFGKNDGKNAKRFADTISDIINLNF